MSEVKPLPCPQQDICTIPKSAACTADQYPSCGMIISLGDVTVFLTRPDYSSLSVPGRAEFLQKHYKVFIDDEEISYPLGQLAKIVKARIEIMQTSSAMRTQ